jgi:hypothetical protein
VVSFGETLNALLRGPEGALGGGGVLGRKDIGLGGLKLSDCGEAKVIRGDAAGCAACGREALGPVGAEMSDTRCITGDCGWLGLLRNRPLLTFGDDGTTDDAAPCEPEASIRLCVTPTSLPGMPSHDLEPCSRWVGAMLDRLLGISAQLKSPWEQLVHRPVEQTSRGRLVGVHPVR